MREIMEKEMPFWNLSFLGYMIHVNFWGGVCTMGHKEYHNIFHLSIDQLKLAIQWNQGIYLASSFQSESNSKSDTVAISQKVTRNRTLQKWFDSFWNGSILEFAISASRCIFGRFQQIQALFFMFGENTPLDTEKGTFSAAPDILRPYNMAIFPKLKHHTLQTRQHSSPHLHRSQLAILQLKKTAKLISPNDICPSLNRQYPTNLQKSIQSSRSSGSSSLICCTASTFWPYMPHDISVKGPTNVVNCGIHQNWF